jgi:hypothetical protein
MDNCTEINQNELTKIEVGWANKKISELYPNNDLPIDTLFKSLKIFSPLLKRYRVY